MEKEFKTIAYIIENTNGQVVELNDGNYLYLSNEVINDIICANKDVYDNIFNKGVKTSESIVEATKKDAEGMSKRINDLEAQLKDYVNYTDKLKDTINSKEAAIAQYVRDIECFNERINNVKNNINKYIEMTDKIDNNFKNNIIGVINKEFESKFANNVESFNWDEHDDSKYL